MKLLIIFSEQNMNIFFNFNIESQNKTLYEKLVYEYLKI